MHGFSYILYDKKNLHESRKVVGKTRGEVYQLLICNQSAYCANSTFSLSNAPRRRAAAPVQLLSSGGAATPSRSNPYCTIRYFEARTWLRDRVAWPIITSLHAFPRHLVRPAAAPVVSLSLNVILLTSCASIFFARTILCKDSFVYLSSFHYF